jgi:hypothetical protein
MTLDIWFHLNTPMERPRLRAYHRYSPTFETIQPEAIAKTDTSLWR